MLSGLNRDSHDYQGFSIMDSRLSAIKGDLTMMSSVIQQYIVDTKGNPTAVILSIESYKKIISIMEDYKEMVSLSQSSEFIEMIRKSLDDVRLNKVALWKDVWDEL